MQEGVKACLSKNVQTIFFGCRGEISRSRRTTTLGNLVVKQQDSEKTRLEFIKTVSASRIANDSSQFLVPKIVAYSESSGLIVFKHIPEIVPLKVIARDEARGPLYASLAGRALARIHEKLALPRDEIRLLPQIWRDDSAPQVFIHGDFNAINVQASTKRHEIIILDWAMSDIWGGDSTYGPAYFDVAFMVHTLFFRNILRSRPIPSVETVAKSFLDAYLEDMDKAEAGPMWNYIMNAYNIFSKNHKHRKNKIQYSLYKPAFNRFRRFLESQIP